MTIEGRPYVGPDNTYEKQRKDRMGDAIGDYLTDEKVSSRQAYEEILSEVQGWIDYHRENLTKAEHLREYLMGSRPIDLEAPASSTQTLYEDILNYDA